MTMILSSMIIMAMTSCLMKHPLSLGINLLAQTILTAMITGFLTMNFWFSYIIFLIMIGGMLIMFTYMTSIASNEKFKFSIKTLNFTVILLFTSMMLSWLMDNFLVSLKLKMKETLLTQETHQFMSLSKFINYPHNMVYMLLVIYLLITLIAIVKISNKQTGALRQMF
uniref:NADH dehydrogenase subunit 6 n=1 Tax=Adiscus speciosus TaxID=2978449 RepID=UPI0021CC7BDF|nr:NADH dehydrogenase subunit 6 [Adiscus speciosus]UWV18194.1 NADH dehydrogenase subunit 6 [Adiscus speciosus]